MRAVKALLSLCICFEPSLLNNTLSTNSHVLAVYRNEHNNIDCHLIFANYLIIKKVHVMLGFTYIEVTTLYETCFMFI